jgi:hypothetical protein
MASYLTSDTLIESVKRRHSIPESQNTFEEDDFLAFANEEIALGILPTLLQYHEEYLVYTQTVALVANQSNYAIPARAVGSKLRNVYYVDSAGNERELGRIEPENVSYYQSGSSSGSAFQYFYLQNNLVVLVPEVGASPTGSLVMDYYLRPNQLVSEDRVATITAINTTTGVITVDGTPDVITNSTPIDFLEARGGHRTKGLDKTPTATGATTITFSPSDLPSDLVVGDHIALACECKIPQIPDDLHAMLAQRVAARCLEALGDQQGLAAANAKLVEMEQKTATLVDNRTEGTPQKVVNLRGTLSRRIR